RYFFRRYSQGREVHAKGIEQPRLKVLGKHTNPMHRRCLLRYTALWPQHRHRGNNFDDLPSPHSITSSARASSDCGTVRPSALAVLSLITSWNLVGCCTGRSAGFARGCVKTCMSQERAALFSLLSFPDGGRQCVHSSG